MVSLLFFENCHSIDLLHLTCQNLLEWATMLED